MRRSTKAFVVGTMIVAAAAGLVTWAVTKDDGAATAQAGVKLSTTKVERKDLVTYSETTATLGFVATATVSSPLDGTVTSIVNPGGTIDAGTVVAYIDGSPVVALVGDIPTFRALSTSSTDGADVRQLEQNLVALGYDPNGSIVINNHFDSSTAAAVKRWQADLGLDEDGKVPKTRVVYVPGRLLVDTVSVTVGGHVGSGGSLAIGRVAERKVLVASTVSSHGTVANQPQPGTEVKTGTVLFTDNGIPVMAIEGDAAALPGLNRALKVGVSDGADVKVLERALVDLGYDPVNAVTVDDHFDGATADAVAAWQAALGVTPADTITVPKGSFVVVPSGMLMGSAIVADGTVIAADAVVATLTEPAREVSTTAPVGDATFVVGATVEVEFPDGTRQNGTVVEVGTTATNTSNTPGATPSVPIAIRVTEIPASVDSFVQIPVTLRVVDEESKDALVVPVSALVALAEGGYAVQVVDATNADGTFASHLVGVETGLFADGFVAVTGSKLRAGQRVVIPS